MTDGDGTNRFGPWQYVTKIRVTVDRQRIEDGYSLDCWDDRQEADIESETVFRGFRQEKSSTISESLPVVDTEQIPSTSNGYRDRSRLMTDGGTDHSYSGRIGWECDRCGRVISIYDRQFHRKVVCGGDGP